MNLNQKSFGKIYLIPTELSLGTGKNILGPQLSVVLTELHLFAVENVRTARRFISSLDLGVDISQLEFLELNKKTDPVAIRQILNEVKKGRNLGVMSEAGCPAIADPGTQLVSFAHFENIKVIPLVGPSSFIMALMASGLSGQRFSFVGYLPIEKKPREVAIIELERRSMANIEAHIFMETPYRNRVLFNDLLVYCKSSTMLCIAYDITGPAEYIKTMPIAKWKKTSLEFNKIPAVFILQAQ